VKERPPLSLAWHPGFLEVVFHASQSRHNPKEASMKEEARIGIGLAIIFAVLMAFVGFAGSSEMIQLQSVSGTSVAEAFYNAVGLWALSITGLALLFVGLTLFRVVIQHRQLEATLQQLSILSTLQQTQGHEARESIS